MRKGHQRTGEEIALLFPLYVADTEAEVQRVPRDSVMHYFDVVARRAVAGDAVMDAATRERNRGDAGPFATLDLRGGA